MSLQPQEWSNLVDRMETNDTLFDLFLEYVIQCLCGCFMLTGRSLMLQKSTYFSVASL